MLKKLHDQITKSKSENFKDFQSDVMEESQLEEIITRIATSFSIPNSLALEGIYLLLLGGCANLSCPLNYKITLLQKKEENEDLTEIHINKENLLYEYKQVMKNNHIRRLAESLATKISEYAEINNLNGDLAKKINTSLIRKGESPLTPKERAWCSSFNQNNMEIASKTKDYNRILRVLATELFEIQQTTNLNPKPKTKTPSPRPKGPGKTNKGGQAKTGK